MRKSAWLSRKSTKVALAVAVAGGVGLTMASPALADYGPAPLDVVGVGSDTVQNIANFFADGKGGTPGFNTTGNKYKLVSLDATGDANDRAVYAKGGTSPLKLSVIYRAGASPQQRANGSGAGITAINADTGPTEVINWVRSSRLPKVSENTTANSNGWGGFHVIKIATDDLAIAAASASTNAVALTPAQVVSVYKCSAGSTDWNTFNSAAPVGSTIIPLIPQAGSGTGDTFRADLKAANGGTDVTLGGCVQTVEENDPSSITGASVPANAIAPFSSGRIALFNTAPNYFHDPSSAFPSSGTVTAGVSLLYGGGPVGAGAQTANACVAPTDGTQTVAYCNTRGLFVVWRESDSNSATAWQPGNVNNWVKTLFWRPVGGGTPYIKTAGGQTAIAAGGVTPTYVDCGVGPTAWSTAGCGTAG
ncbi:MAG: hypothetical protein QOJ34_1201 [Pseudonocardiales bacterium]|jgi:hypothetical protein|nr:hypothetical protein [Pseudonocardiales bacterium]